MNANEKYFEEVVGQNRAKNELGFYLDNLRKSGAAAPHILFLGSKGDGKTHLARKFAKNMPDGNNPGRMHKAFYPCNGSLIQTPTQLLEDVLAKVQGQYCTIFIDEAHELAKKVQTMLLSILEPNRANRTSVVFNDVEYLFDFKKITFLFATTEDSQVFHALRDRLVPIALEPYNEQDLAEIIELVIESKTSFEPGLLPEVARHVRRNARSADRMAKNILSLNCPIFKKSHFRSLKRKLNLFPYGVNHREIRALEVLRNSGECALGQLASRLAAQPRSVQIEIEPYLIACGLMEIDGKRRITAKGREFLKKIPDLAKNNLTGLKSELIS